MNARPLHSIAKVTELMWLLADAGESCASVSVVAELSMQSRFRGYPVEGMIINVNTISCQLAETSIVAVSDE